MAAARNQPSSMLPVVSFALTPTLIMSSVLVLNVDLGRVTTITRSHPRNPGWLPTVYQPQLAHMASPRNTQPLTRCVSVRPRRRGQNRQSRVYLMTRTWGSERLFSRVQRLARCAWRRGLSHRMPSGKAASDLIPVTTRVA